MKVFLVRHAEGEDFTEKWQSPQTPLSDKGKRQAEALGKLPRFKVIDTVITSRWKRAEQTAQIVASLLNKPLEVLEGVEERRQSAQIYGLLRTDPTAERYFKDTLKNRSDWDWKWDAEEESYNELVRRAVKFKDYLLETRGQKNMLVFSHEAFLRCLITVCIFGNNPEQNYFKQFFRSMTLELTGISLLVYREEYKVWKLWYLNDYSHLGFVRP